MKFNLAFCTDEHPTIRISLSGGKHGGEGLLQVEYQGKMGTVCGDGWSMNAANVACRQLGYTAALRTSSGEEFGGVPSAMWMSYVTCNGSEEKLQDCTHSGLDDFSKGCTHPIGVGVVCGGVSSHKYTYPTHMHVFVYIAGIYILFNTYIRIIILFVCNHIVTSHPIPWMHACSYIRIHITCCFQILPFQHLVLE